MECKATRVVDYSIPRDHAAFEDEDKVCKMLGPEFEW